MEAKRADSQGFGIDQLNTLQTFEEWSPVLSSSSGIMVGSSFICLKYSFLKGCAFLCLHRLENMGKRCKETIRATNSTTLCVSIYLNRLCTWDWNCVSIRTQET